MLGTKEMVWAQKSYSGRWQKMGLPWASWSHFSWSIHTKKNPNFIWWLTGWVRLLLYRLTAYEEELAWYWCQSIGT